MSNRNLVTLLTIALGSGALASTTSCLQTECGEGTISQDGTCIPSDQTVTGATCGEGTVLENGQCVPEQDPTVCDPNTTTPDTTQIPGVTVCVGTGGSSSCDTDFVCAAPTAGKISVCGRILHVEDESQVKAESPMVKSCTNGGATDGPCSLGVLFYDAIDFAGSNGNGTPLAVGNFDLDDCGRFRAESIALPQSGFLGIGVEDTGAANVVAKTGTALPTSSGQTINRLKIYVVDEQSNVDWSQQAGLSSGTFESRGAFMTVFYQHSQTNPTPTAGVKITEAGNVESANDYYFDDTDGNPLTRETIDPLLDATTEEGAGIKINSGLSAHGGTGGEPSGCVWQAANAAAIPSVIFFSPRIAIQGTSPTGLTPCP